MTDIKKKPHERIASLFRDHYDLIDMVYRLVVIALLITIAVVEIKQNKLIDSSGSVYVEGDVEVESIKNPVPVYVVKDPSADPFR